MSAIQTPPAAKKPQPEVKPAPPPDLETYAEVGDPIEWCPSADPTAEPWCAIVSQVLLGGQVTASTISPHWKDTLPMTPCFHMSDKAARLDGNQEGGGWRHKPQTLALRRMLLAQGFLRWEGGKLVAAEPPKGEPKA